MSTEPAASELTQAIRRASAGDSKAWDQVLPRVYEELHKIAARAMAKERPGHTLQVTAVVNEAFLKLADQHSMDYRDRRHFFAMAVTHVRRILTDHARARSSQKRGADAERVTLAGVAAEPQNDPVDLLALDEALLELAVVFERCARVVELRFFGGLNVDDVAAELDVSARTVADDWVFAKAWLKKRMSQ